MTSNNGRKKKKKNFIIVALSIKFVVLLPILTGNAMIKQEVTALAFFNTINMLTL